MSSIFSKINRIVIIPQLISRSSIIRHFSSSYDPMRPPNNATAMKSNQQQQQQQQQQPPTDFITSTAPPKRSPGSSTASSTTSATTATTTTTTTNKKTNAQQQQQQQTLPFVGVQLSNEQVLRAVIEQSSIPTLLVAIVGSDSGSMQFLSFLEKLAESKYANRLRVVSVDVDALPEFADMLRIETVPTIVAMVNGKQVATFGPVPPPEMEKFLNKLVELGPPTEQALDTMQSIDAAYALMHAKKFADASKRFVELNSAVSGDANLQTLVVAGLLRCAIALDHPSDAAELCQYIRSTVSGGGAAASGVENTKRKPLPPRPLNVDKRIIGALDAFDLYDMRTKLDRSTTNDDAMHLQLIEALDHWAAGRIDETLKALLDMVRKDKKWREEIARHTYVKVCNILLTMMKDMQLLDVH